MTWVLIACMSHGMICNVFLHLEFFDQQDCSEALVELVRENDDWTHANCVPLDVAKQMMVNPEEDA